MKSQFYFFKQDVKRLLGKYKIRILHIWFSRVFLGIFMYRLERAFFLIFGNSYSKIRILFLPLFNIIYAYSNIEINYKADIKGGILILHPAVGVVISGLSVIGENITLTGGNIIGANSYCKPRGIKIGDNCNLGANAVIIGPVVLLDNITIGASACVVKDCFQKNVTLVGVPAKEI